MYSSLFIYCCWMLCYGCAKAFSLQPMNAFLAKNTNGVLTEQKLIARAKEVADTQTLNFGFGDDGECLAEDFKFIGAVVGPLNKADYLKAGTYSLNEFNSALELDEQLFGFHGDPEIPNRIWFMTHQTAIHSKGPLNGAEPTGKQLVLPPQTMFFDFNDDLQVTQYGLYTVDRNYGNTGGIGGLLGYYYGVGKPAPYPEGQPYKPSLAFTLFNLLGKITVGLTNKSDGLEIESVKKEI